MRLEHGTALVTGASSGIGAALAVQLVRRGMHVIAHGRDPQRLAALAEIASAPNAGRASPLVTPIMADLATPGGPDLLAERLLATGPIDLLISNAGAGWAGSFTDITADRLDEILALNLRAPVRLAHALLPAMLDRGKGHLVFVGSIAGRLGVRHEAVYAAAKAGLDVFVESLRAELAETPVRLTFVIPAVVRTPFFDRRGRPYDRSRPRPIPADRAAAAILAAIEHDRPELYLPSWMRLPVVVRSLFPGGYRRLARRFG